MTSALFDTPSDGWTTDDLDELPEDGRRRELVDGVLIVSPSPTNIHQVIVWRLAAALDVTCPPDCHVTQGVEVRINSRRTFIPDVLVTTSEGAERGGKHFLPHEVVLAVEVVSPGSQSMDRVLKPALYAEAGIPYFWRVETAAELTVYTHRIQSDHGKPVYLETGAHTETIETAEPWPINIPIGQITPRYYKGS